MSAFFKFSLIFNDLSCISKLISSNRKANLNTFSEIEMHSTKITSSIKKTFSGSSSPNVTYIIKLSTSIIAILSDGLIILAL